MGKMNNKSEIYTGIPQSATPTSIILDEKASNCDGAYTGLALRIIEGAGCGEQQTIKSYDGKSKIAMLHGIWSTIPDITSIYAILALGLGGGEFKSDSFQIEVDGIIICGDD